MHDGNNYTNTLSVSRVINSAKDKRKEKRCLISMLKMLNFDIMPMIPKGTLGLRCFYVAQLMTQPAKLKSTV